MSLRASFKHCTCDFEQWPWPLIINVVILLYNVCIVLYNVIVVCMCGIVNDFTSPVYN